MIKFDDTLKGYTSTDLIKQETPEKSLPWLQNLISEQSQFSSMTDLLYLHIWCFAFCMCLLRCYQ